MIYINYYKIIDIDYFVEEERKENKVLIKWKHIF